MRLLVVENDALIALAICAALRKIGHIVDHVADSHKADVALFGRRYDLVILAFEPLLDAKKLLVHLRHRCSEIHVIVTTAFECPHERARVLDLGADDHLVKPFAISELIARVRAQLRRRLTHGLPQWRMARLRIDVNGRSAWTGDRRLPLSRRQFDLLEALVARRDRVTSRDELIEALCSWDSDFTANCFDVALHYLRRKLEGSGIGVRTFRGRGYMLTETGFHSSGHRPGRRGGIADP